MTSSDKNIQHTLKYFILRDLAWKCFSFSHMYEGKRSGNRVAVFDMRDVCSDGGVRVGCCTTCERVSEIAVFIAF